MKLVQRLVIAAGTGVAFAALAAPAQAASAHNSAPATVRSDTQQSHRHLSEQDAHFLVTAHQGNLAEIAAGRVALAKSHNAEVRAIATRLIADHLRLDAGVRSTAAAHHLALPALPTREQRAALRAVARKSGKAFDHAWLRLQETSHVKTLALIDQELRHGHAADVKAVARTAKPVVKMHLEMVRAALNEH